MSYITIGYTVQRGGDPMPDSEAKKRWIKENSKIVTIKMMNKGDKDIMDYLEDKPTATTIKAALREYMQNHPDK